MGGGCHFGKIVSVGPGLFGEEQIVLIEMEGAVKAVSPAAVSPLKKDIRSKKKTSKRDA